MSATVVHGQSSSIASKNRDFFDKHAKTAYKEQWVMDLVRQITDYLVDNREWIGFDSKAGQTRVLDYACGSGIISMRLQPFSTAVRGIDVSGGMVEQYNAMVEERGLNKNIMRAVRGDLLQPEPELASLEFRGFDIVIMSMALHHVSDAAEMIVKLAERLGAGGSLVIVDWVDEQSDLGGRPHGGHGAAHTCTRHGFVREELAAMAIAAGLVDFDWKLHPQTSTVPGAASTHKQLFFARAKRPGGN